MLEAVFQFRATGEVDVSSLVIDYGSAAPSEEWCHAPYVLQVDDASGNLYELRFPLSPFGMPENGSTTRTCTVSGPLYVIPKYNVPILDVNLTIKQIACLDKLNCEDLLNQIDIFVNTEEDFVSPDGGLIAVERDGYDPFFTERAVSLLDEDGNPCTWASFDEDGNVQIERRGFDENGNSQRRVTVTYSYTYSYEGEIDNNSCYDEFSGEIIQRARACEEADVEANDLNVDFDKDGGSRNLNDIIVINGLDASAYEIKSIDDISCVGDAFGLNPITYSPSKGYFINVLPNNDPNTNLLEDKTGTILVTYHNKYLDKPENPCVYIAETTVYVQGLSCDEVSENVYFAIKINDEGDYLRSSNIIIPGGETTITVYILGDGYADYFDINEDECEIPDDVIVTGTSFIIPLNPDPLAQQRYEFKFVGEIMDEQYSSYSAFGCQIEQTFVVTQEIHQEITDIGDIVDKKEEICESIEPIPSEELTYNQDCGYVELLTGTDFEHEQACGSISPVSNTDEVETSCLPSIDDLDNGNNRAGITQVCE